MDTPLQPPSSILSPGGKVPQCHVRGGRKHGQPPSFGGKLGGVDLGPARAEGVFCHGPWGAFNAATWVGTLPSACGKNTLGHQTRIHWAKSSLIGHSSGSGGQRTPIKLPRVVCTPLASHLCGGGGGGARVVCLEPINITLAPTKRSLLGAQWSLQDHAGGEQLLQRPPNMHRQWERPDTPGAASPGLPPTRYDRQQQHKSTHIHTYTQRETRARHSGWRSCRYTAVARWDGSRSRSCSAVAAACTYGTGSAPLWGGLVPLPFASSPGIGSVATCMLPPERYSRGHVVQRAAAEQPPSASGEMKGGAGR